MIDIAIVLLSGSGARFYEKRKKSKAVKEPQKAAKDLSIVPPADKTELTQKERQHRNNVMNGVTQGAATLRAVTPAPLFNLLDIASYTYAVLPFYRRVETAVKQRLIKDRKVNSDLLMGLDNAMLPLLEISKENTGGALGCLEDDAHPSTSAEPAVQVYDSPVEFSPAPTKIRKYHSAA
jgi:hypothetical protein